MYHQSLHNAPMLQSNSQRGIYSLYLAALMLILIGIAALATAVSITFLPHETAYLQTSVSSLNHAHHDHSLIGFIIHNRIAFGGTLIVLGWLYLWLSHYPLRQGQRWAWWALLLSAFFGSSSFFAYLRRGYFDPWHASGTVAITAVLAFGLWHTYPRTPAHKPQNHLSLTTLIQSPIHLLATIWAMGNFLGGIGVFLAGLWPVFVPQDLAYMQTTATALDQLNSRLIAFIAHDRSGFGGALLALGIVLIACIYFVNETQRQALWPHLFGIWLLHTLTSIVVHPIVGYNSLSHLLPFLVKDTAFLLAWLLHSWQKPIPLTRPVRSGNETTYAR